MSNSKEALEQLAPTNDGCSPKPTVAFIHGLGLNSVLWEPLLPYMSNKYDAIMYHLPGHGVRPDPAFPVAWDDLCDDLLSVLNRSDQNRIHLVGHGFGANLAIKLASRHPELVASLSLISLPGFIPADYMMRAIEERSRLIRSINRSGFIEKIIPALTVNPNRPDFRSIIWDAFHQVSSASYVHLMQLFARNDNIRDLRSLSLPILMLSGEKDPVYTPALSAITSSYAGGCRFLVVPNASNLTFLDQPKWTAEWLSEHIDSADAGGPAVFSGSPRSIDEGTHALHKIIHLGERLLQTENELNIQLLHKFQISVNGVEIVSGWNKRLAKKLLLYLVLFPNATRQQLYDDLWPDSELRKAQNYLRVCLNHLKSLLERHSDGFEFLRIDREHITINGTIKCDLLVLMNDLDEAMEEPDEVAKEARIHSIFGKLPRHILSGYIDDWILGLREKIEGQLAELAGWMERRAESGERKLAAAVGLGHGLLRHPFQEDQDL